MKILITGGCGYKGTVLVPYLLDKGHEIIVIDTQWFGNYLDKNKNLNVFKSDIRSLNRKHLKGVDIIIHLANIANDPSVDLNPVLSWEINVLATQQLADMAVREGVKQFIYASSGSVYGIRHEKNVTEDLPLVPISTYNKTKMISERILISYRENMIIHCIRPATVCGYSRRMRFDISVNMFVQQAFSNNKITVFGGEQTRPNIHIKDMIRVYNHFIDNPQIESGFYNAGFENMSIIDLARMIAEKSNAKIVKIKTNDSRSYRQNSDLLISTGFIPKYCVKDGVDELNHKFKHNKLEINDNNYNVKWMKVLEIN
jgi:nucleoside-diphosphate-sugar epimerase